MELELPSPVDDLPSPVDDSSIDLPDCDDGIEALASCPTQRSAVCMKKPASRECRRPWLEDLPQDDSGDDWSALVDDALDDFFFLTLLRTLTDKHRPICSTSSASGGQGSRLSGNSPAKSARMY